MYKFWYSTCTYIRNDPPSSVFILTCASRRATQGPPTESGFILPGLVYMGGSCAFLILQTGLWTRQRASPQPLPYLPVDGRYFCMIPRHEIAPAHTKAHTDDKQTRQQPCAHTRSGLERTLVRGVFIRAPAPALSPTTRTSLFPRRCACRRPDLSHVFYLFLSGA